MTFFLVLGTEVLLWTWIVVIFWSHIKDSFTFSSTSENIHVNDYLAYGQPSPPGWVVQAPQGYTWVFTF